MQGKLGKGGVLEWGKRGIYTGEPRSNPIYVSSLANIPSEFSPVPIAPTTKTPYAHTTVRLTISSIMANTVGHRIYKGSNHTEIVDSVLQGGQTFNYGG